MNIHEATTSYENWMRKSVPVVQSQLRDKHERMRQDLFMFFRGTYYRWAQLWPDVCRDLTRAPSVLACGDFHVGSFGTWRDIDGRLCWGTDDFDEAYPLAYTNDLVRLAASVKIVIDSEDLTIKFRDACDAVLDGYRKSLNDGGCPMVLAERETNLEKLGVAAIEPPQDFWPKLNHRASLQNGHFPAGARKAIDQSWPGNVSYRVVSRESGMGSLGQPRYVAIAEWCGGFVAREVKQVLPSSSVWLSGRAERGEPYYDKILESAVRSPDPYQKVVGDWLVRRLSPDSNPIEVEDLPKQRDESVLIHAMGSEAANIHLGTRKQRARILADLRRQPANWLRKSAKEMAKTITKDWKKYRSG